MFALCCAFVLELNWRAAKTLQIFEPSFSTETSLPSSAFKMHLLATGYRQLYHDVLTSGQNTFVVTAADADSGRLAAYGNGPRHGRLRVAGTEDQLLTACIWCQAWFFALTKWQTWLKRRKARSNTLLSTPTAESQQPPCSYCPCWPNSGIVPAEAQAHGGVSSSDPPSIESGFHGRTQPLLASSGCSCENLRAYREIRALFASQVTRNIARWKMTQAI